jgi:hypothetical protein
MSVCVRARGWMVMGGWCERVRVCVCVCVCGRGGSLTDLPSNTRANNVSCRRAALHVRDEETRSALFSLVACSCAIELETEP